MQLQNVRQSIKFYANACLGSLLFIAATAQAAPKDEAGEVTFLLGKAFVNGSTPVTIGTKVGSGDVIQTLGNGHVHVRFIDSGLVSVRPESRLVIEQYQYNASQPNESIIKFNLEQGVMRSISGEGAKSARDKFRLNTPIAAIGVRGTDFVVKSSSDLLQAVVNEGAIIVAPYSVDCQAASVGPCQSSNMVELASDAQQLLEFSSMYESPRLLPLSAGIPTISIDETQIQSQPHAAKTTENDVSTSNTTSKSNQESDTLDRSDLDNRLVSEITADTFINAQPNEDRAQRLMWGRYSGPKATDRIVYSREVAANGRDLTVLPSPFISDLALYRTSSENRLGTDSSLGNVSFNLLASQATVNTGGMLSVASVSSANSHLSIDFTNGKFATEVMVTSPLIDPVTVSGSGKISDRGFFNFTSGDTAIHGASTLDGDASSFMFHKDVGAGTSVEGVTHWYAE